MPYNMFLDFSVFFGYLRTESSLSALYVDKDNKNLAYEHILLFFFFPHEMFIHFSAML